MKIHRFATLTFAYLFTFALSALFVNNASADLIVDFESKSIAPGGQQDISIFVRSDSGDQDLYFYDVSYLLIPLNAAAGTTTTYIDPLSENFIVDDQISPEYVFFGNSALGDGSPNNVLDVQEDQMTGEDTVVLALDETFSGDNEIVGTEPKLLSQVTVQHNLNGATAAQVAGNTFEISLGRMFPDDFAFALLDADFNEVAIPYSVGTRGIITVEAIAIPEPSTFAFTSLMTLGILPMRRRRR